MKILFSHSYFLRLDPKQWRAMQPYPPLATLFAASVMRDEKYEVRLHDVMFSSGAEELLPVLNEFQPSYFVVYDDGFNYLTKMCLTNMREEAFKMIQQAKKKGCITIVSSSDATDHYEKYLSAGADYVILGEAEVTLKELIQSLEKKNDVSVEQLQGIARKSGDTTVVSEKREVLRDLDSIPLPAWDLVHVKQYEERWRGKHGYFSLNMVTTRGCPYRCNWCAKPIYGNRYNSRSPENVLKELKILMEKYKPDHIWFSDDIFGLKPHWVQRFSKLVEKEQLRFKYKIQSRADLLVHEDTVSCLAQSGCDTVWLGAESGSQKILDAMDKGITTSQIHKARQMLKQHGVKAAFFLQFGYLGENYDDVDSTVKMLRTLLPDEIGISVSYPLPGTKFYDTVKQKMGEKANWTDSDDLAMMFRDDIHPGYYKQLQRFVHKDFQFHRSKSRLKELMSGKVNTQSLIPAAKIFYYGPARWYHKWRLHQYESGQ